MLVRRASDFVGDVTLPTTPERLADAAKGALEVALERTGDRGAALDLLAADALVTLALAAQVETDPAGLARFARAVRGQESIGP